MIEGLACWLTLCILEKIICNSTNSVQISFIETLKLIVFSWTIWWCYWKKFLMINEKNNFLTVSWLSGLLSAEIFISTDATPNLWKQLFSAVRASGGYPGNVPKFSIISRRKTKILCTFAVDWFLLDHFHTLIHPSSKCTQFTPGFIYHKTFELIQTPGTSFFYSRVQQSAVRETVNSW